ncbi:MAG TPA: pyridoxal-phosphate dependent enzyme [Candidatus Caldiarchaeum subterraneum]|uniref:Pyridoxal-phosphate dependent enzyme n=1 Tax=Caldiarchaeum subterraneum TaxID=311458 RepID=A0A833A3K0_CALS0|nr:pyridoxal-phosphate dependent enzyme [Candidatus Caldarchaeum subterraneum]
MKEEVYCYTCGNPRGDLTEWRCKSCGGAYTLEHDNLFSQSKIINSRFNMWRYADALSPSIRENPVTLGEGCTPLINPITPNIHFKLEYVMPTASFKDRGSSAVVSYVRSLMKRKKIRGVVEDSSGNAGASITAYSSFLGIECRVYVPKGSVGHKVKQIEQLGGRVEEVDGSREDAAKKAQEAKDPYLYIGHAWSPYFIEGIKTLAYEVVEQLKWSIPEVIYLPAASGTLLLGVIYGYKTLLNSGVIEKCPKIVAVQQQEVSTIHDTFYGLPSHRSTYSGIADALNVKNPPRLNEIITELRKVGGEVKTVRRSEIIRAARELGLMGMHVEYSAAVAYAAFRKKLEDFIYSDTEAVIILTGSGLKSI